jgi:hypothetical protein
MSDDDEVIVLCARITTPLYIPDNRIGRCSECGWKVQFRPHAPRGRRMCMVCAATLVEDGATMEIPPRMLQDLQTYYRKKLQ